MRFYTMFINRLQHYVIMLNGIIYEPTYIRHWLLNVCADFTWITHESIIVLLMT